MAKFTIAQFREAYPTEDACLDKIFQMTYGSLNVCPTCRQESCITRVKNRRCYQCSRCSSQFYPTAGTPFEKTRTPLSSWLYVLYLFTTTRNGVAAKEIQRQLGVTYKCAWRMGHQIRILIGEGISAPLEGIVEADETYVGGKVKNMHKKRRNTLREGRGNVNKTAVFGMLERGVGVRVKVIPSEKVSGRILKPIIRKMLGKDATLITDGFGAYKDLDLEYTHEIVNHSKHEYVRGNFHTNGIEGFWSQLKRTIGGTHIQVSRKHLQKYANEAAFRFNNAFKGEKMFDTILSHLPVVE